MFINTSSIIPSICARYLSNTRSDNSNSKINSNVSSNNDVKIISDNCLSYNGYLLYIIECYKDDVLHRPVERFISFDDFILDLFKYCYRNKKDDYDKELHNMLNYLFENRYLKYCNSTYRLLII